MANLPTVDTEIAVSPQVRSSVTAADVAASLQPARKVLAPPDPYTPLPPTPYKAIAEAMFQVGGVIGDIGAQYERAQAAALMARESQEARNAAQTFEMEANGNAEEFQATFDAYAQKRLADIPEKLQPGLAAEFVTIGGSTFRDIRDQRFKLDIATSAKTLNDEITFQDDQIAALARGGQAGTPADEAARAKLYGLYGELTENPVFGVSEEMAGLDIQRKESRWMAEGIVGHALSTYRSGGMAASAREIDKLLTDPDLALSPEERQHYRSLYIEQLSTEVSARASFLRDAQSGAKALQERLKVDDRLVDGREVDEAVNNLYSLGDPSGANDLIVARARARQLQGFKTLDDPAQVAAYGKSNGAAPASIVDKIIGVESGGNANAANPNSTAVGLGQFTEGTWLDMVRKHRPDLLKGRTRGDVLSLRRDPTISRQMTGYLVEDNSRFLAGRGLAVTPGNVYLAHFLGQGGAASLLGADPNALASSVLGADQVAANKSILAGKTVAEVQAWADRKMGGASIGVAYDPAKDADTISAMRTEITADFSRNLGAMQEGLARGLPPALADLNLLADQVAVVGDAEARNNFASFLTQYEDGLLLKNVPPDQQDLLLGRLRAGITEDGRDGMTVMGQEYIRGLEAQKADLQKRLKEDPLQLEIETARAVPIALDFADSGQLTAGLAQRAQVAAQAESRWQTTGIPALTKNEQAAVGAYWTAADPVKRAQLLADLNAGIGDRDTLLATLGTFTGKTETQALAIAGALQGIDPATATAIVRGEAAITADAKFAFGPTDADYLAARDEILPATALAPTATAAWSGNLDAARAVYADLSARAGDSSGKFNEERWTNAINAVTGGVLDFNGRPIVAPAHGIGQGRFDDIMAALPEVAVAGAQTPGGMPVTMQFVRDYGVLRSYGDGRYQIELGEDTGVFAVRAPRSGEGVGGGGFILDLRPFLSGGPPYQPALRPNDVDVLFLEMGAARAQGTFRSDMGPN